MIRHHYYECSRCPKKRRVIEDTGLTPIEECECECPMWFVKTTDQHGRVLRVRKDLEENPQPTLFRGRTPLKREFRIIL